MTTIALQFRGGWLLERDDTLQPGAVGTYKHVYGEDPYGVAIDITTDPTVTQTVAQIIQQWESSSGNLLCPLAYDADQLEAARLARGLEPITLVASLIPLPKIYSGAGGGDATSLQGFPISAVPPVAGKALVYSGAQWEAGGWNKGPRIVVGNSVAGDTLEVCDYLDVGDGVQLQAALTAAGAPTPKLDVWVRPGNYTFATAPMNVPSLVTMRCSGWGTIFNATATQRKCFILGASASIEDVSIVVPVPAAGATGTEVVELGTGTWLKRFRIVMTAQTAPQAALETLRAGIKTIAAGAGVHMSFVRLQMISFRALGIAQDMEGISLESLLSGSMSALVDTYVQGMDIGYNLRGAVSCTNWHANVVSRISVRLASTNVAGASREGPRLGAGMARMLALAGTPQFGVQLDTGTDAAGMIGACVSDCMVFTTSVEATSCGYSLIGTGVGASINNCQSNAFPLGMSVAVGQTNARGVNITIRSSTAPSPTVDASGSAIFPNAQVF